MNTTARPRLKVADEVWVATALLHREQPGRADFSVREIIERLRREHLSDEVRGSVHVHVIQHCVANRAPNPAAYRMLLETGPSRRRLYRPGDPAHRDRRGRISPLPEGLPETYRHLLQWYENEYAGPGGRRAGEPDPLLVLRGSGRTLWAEEHADEYVKRLREGWT